MVEQAKQLGNKANKASSKIRNTFLGAQNPERRLVDEIH